MLFESNVIEKGFGATGRSPKRRTFSRVVIAAIVTTATGCGSSDDAGQRVTTSSDASSVDSARAPDVQGDTDRDANATDRDLIDSDRDLIDSDRDGSDTDRGATEPDRDASVATSDADASTDLDASDADGDVKAPSVADNPPTPVGYKPMMQSEVTAEMTAWAVTILQDPTDYPMFSTATKTFGALTVLVRVEWHPPDFQNGVVHRGVTLYEPA
jgi:hypothetical protein